MSDIVPPCDCAELVDGQFVSRCYCSNRDDGERTAAWCVEANYKAAADYDRCTIEFLRKEAAEAATRITQLEAEVERLLRYNEDRELAARDMADTAAARIEQLEAENASLASWQCEFTDGKTGLVYGEGGSTYCAMAKRVKQLEAALRGVVEAWDWWQVDTYDRCSSVPGDAISDARAALAAPSGAMEERT